MLPLSVSVTLYKFVNLDNHITTYVDGQAVLFIQHINCSKRYHL